MRFLVSVPRFVPQRAFGAQTYLKGLLGGLDHLSRNNRAAPTVLCNRCAEAWICAAAPMLAVRSISTRAALLDLVSGSVSAAVAQETESEVVFFPLNIGWCRAKPTALFVHDLVSHFYQQRLPAYRPWKMRVQRAFLERSIRRAATIGVPTAAVADEIAAAFAIPRSAIGVMHEAVIEIGPPREPRDLVRALAGRPFFLQAGSSLPHKDLATGICAVLQTRATQKAAGASALPVLVLAGSADALSAAIQQRPSLKHVPDLEDAVICAGRLTDAELDWAMREAIAVLMTSLYEGFGLSVIEAQRRGTAVIASRIDVFKEVSGGQALFFDPGNADAAGRALTKVLTEEDLRRGVAEAGQRNAQRFDWLKHARSVIDLIETARAR